MAKLASLTLHNFRQHRKLELQFEPLTIILGPNGSGKSSIVAALDKVISGQCEYDGAPLVTHGASKGSIALVSANATGSTITRGLDPHTLALSWHPARTLKEAQPALEKAIGCSAEKARVALRSAQFFSLPSERRNSLLWEMLELEIGAEQVVLELKRQSTATGLALYDTALAAVGSEAGLGNLRGAHHSCYTRRTEVNGALKELALAEKRLISEGETLSHADSAALADAEKRLAVLEAEAKALRVQRDQIEVPRHDGGRRAQILRQDLNQLTKRLAESDEDTMPTSDDLQEAIANFRLSIKDLQADYARDLAQYEEALRAQKEAADALRSAQNSLYHWEKKSAPGTACENCGHQTDALIAHQREGEDLAQLVASLQLQLEACEVPDKPSREAIRWHEGHLSSALDLQHRLELRAKDQEALARLAADCEAAEAEYKQAEAALKEARHKIGAIDERLQAIRLESQPLQQQIQDGRAYDTYAQRLSDTRERLAKLEAERECLQALVPLFDDKGPRSIRQQVVAGQLGAFVSECNAFLERRGLRLKADDTTGNLLASKDGDGWTPVEGLSKGERLLVALSVQVAFARRSGLGIVCVDDCESLDADAQRLLVEVAIELTQGEDPLDHVCLLAVSLWGLEALPGGPGVAVVDLSLSAAEVTA